MLGKPRKATTNIPSLAWSEVPEFYKSLDEGTVTHLALKLLILTGVRSRPIRYLREEQIDGDVWTIPAEQMKGREGATAEFRVPLSNEALHVLGDARRHARDGFLFPSIRKGVISDATMSRLMERRGMSARPHGFRSSLRVWLAEATDARHEVAETMLGHVVGSSVERAYRRTDFLDQRRVLLERWASHLTDNTDHNHKIGHSMNQDRRYLPLYNEAGEWIARPDLYVLVRMGVPEDEEDGTVWQGSSEHVGTFQQQPLRIKQI